MADELVEDATIEVQHLREVIKEWDRTLLDAGADVDIDSIPDTGAFIEKAREVSRLIHIVAREDES
jgi:hypothetical protein